MKPTMVSHKNHLPLFLLLLIHHTAKAHVFIYAGCSQEKYQPNETPFAETLNTFLTTSSSSASQSSYNTFTTTSNNISTSPQEYSSLFGLYQCRGDLKPTDCANCIQGAASQITLVCPYSYGASLQLEGCYIRYDHGDNFLNILDTSLVYNKCSKSRLDNDAGFVQKRDVLLPDLVTANGFKASSSGSVQGLAQCTGDLSQGDCSSCLAQAAVKAKALCGSAAAAHVFLGKCYVQFWESGYYDINSVSDGTTNQDDVGKIVAIIVGIIGGLAIFIVLLSICRRSVDHYH